LSDDWCAINGYIVRSPLLSCYILSSALPSSSIRSHHHHHLLSSVNNSRSVGSPWSNRFFLSIYNIINTIDDWASIMMIVNSMDMTICLSIRATSIIVSMALFNSWQLFYLDKNADNNNIPNIVVIIILYRFNHFNSNNHRIKSS
jgi:hypothetical protein